jgi:hypothetical protein
MGKYVLAYKRGGSALSGYSIISADSLSDACDKAKGCPVLSSRGSIEVYEARPIR